MLGGVPGRDLRTFKRSIWGCSCCFSCCSSLVSLPSSRLPRSAEMSAMSVVSCWAECSLSAMMRRLASRPASMSCRRPRATLTALCSLWISFLQCGSAGEGICDLESLMAGGGCL